MDNNDYRWSLGTLIGLPLAILLTVLLLAGTVLFFVLFLKERKSHSYASDPGFMLAFFVACLVGFVCSVGGTLWGMYPFSAEYHQWQQTAGVVSSVDSRLIANGDGSGSSERFVVEFDDGRQRACDDTRCAQVEEGDVLELYCKRAYQWTGSHGYDCAFSSITER